MSGNIPVPKDESGIPYAGGAVQSALGANSSTTPLASGATFTGEGEATPFPDVMVVCKTDNSGTLYFDFSPDGENWDSTFPPEGYKVVAGINEFHVARVGARYFRVRLVNDSGAQTYLRLYTYYGSFNQGIAPFNLPLAGDADAIAIRGDSEEEVMKGRVADQYIISKFGENPDVDAAEDINDTGGDYAGVPNGTAENFEVLSSADADNGGSATGALTVRLYYLNDDYEMFDSNGDYLYVDVTMNGQTGVDSGVSGQFVWRTEVISSGSGQTNAGDITVRHITTTSRIFMLVRAGTGNSEITAFVIPAGYKGYLKRFNCEMTDNTSNYANMALKVLSFGTNTYRIIRPFKVSTDTTVTRRYYGGIEFNEKTFFTFRATAINNANGIINVDYGLLLVKQ